MRFKGLDLNLLVAFDALIELRNVTRAAERLNLSQPALSAALNRLRDYFSDELLVAHGKRLYPTALAERLHPQVRSCLKAADGVVATSAPFDPATAARTFRIIASDYVVAALLARVAQHLTAVAPAVRLEFILPDDAALAGLVRGEADIAISPTDYLLANLPREALYEEHHVIIGWNQNPLLSYPISKEALLDAKHVTATIGSRQAKTFADRQLEHLGYYRQVDAVTSSFTMLPWMVIGTNRLAIMHERLALAMSKYFPIASQPMPFAFPPMREMVQYHQSREADDGLRWLIGLLQKVANALSISNADDQ